MIRLRLCIADCSSDTVREAPPSVRYTPIASAVALALLSIGASAGARAQALPTGGSFVAGSGTISQPNATTTLVTQTTQRGATEWQTFNVAPGYTFRADLPNASSVHMARAVGVTPSTIGGTVTSNGQLFLLNPNGIWFTQGASVDVGGLVASTLNLSNADFMKGNYAFTGGAGSGAIVNEATIRVPKGGYVAFLGKQVHNKGTIVASNGSVAFGAGDSMLLDFDGDGLLQLKVNAAAADASIAHGGVIQADGGRVIMSAAAKNALLKTVLNVDGMIFARGMTERNGQIWLDGGRSGVTAVAGTLDASSVAGGKGGDIRVLGEYVGLFGNALLDASGATGGGTVLVGGDFQGRKADIPNAFGTYVGKDARISADAIAVGDGGKVIVWADDVTRYYGSISARGGAQGGNGGFVEVSGKRLLAFNGAVDTTAAFGDAGLLLLDPVDINIVAGAGIQDAELLDSTVSFTDPGIPPSTNFQLGAATISALATPVVLQAQNDINVGGAINKGAGDLTMQAGNNINVNASINVGGSLTLSARDPGTTQVAGGTVTLSAGVTAGGSVTITNNGSTSALTVGAGGVTAGAGSAVSLTGGPIVLTGNVSGTGVTLNATGAASDITGSGAVSAGTGALTLTAGREINLGGALSGTALTGTAGTSAALTNTNNNVGNLGAFTTGSGFTLNHIGALNVTGAVAGGTGTAGITTTGNLSVGANVSGTTAVQLAANADNALINVATGVGVVSPGNVTLTGDRINIVGTGFIAGDAASTANATNVVLQPFSAARPITVGGADDVSAATPAGTLGITNTEVGRILATNLTIGSATNTGGITVGAVDAVTGGTKNIELLTAGTLAVDATRGISTTGNLTLTANNMTLAGGAISGTNVTLRPTTGGQLIDLGGGDAAGTLGLTNVELNTIATGATQALTVGRDDAGNAAGNITVTAPIDAGGTAVLVLRTDGAVTQTATVMETNLGVFAGTGITLDGANGLTAFYGSVSAAGAAITVNDASTVLNAGNVLGSETITTNNGNVSLTTQTNLNIVRAINVGNAQVTLTAATGSITTGNPAQGSITAGTLTGSAATTAAFSASNNAVTNLGAFTTNGAFTLVNSTPLNVTGAVTTTNNGLASITTSGTLAVTTGSVAGAGVTLAATGGTSDITLNGAITGNAGTVTLNAGRLISQTATGLVSTTGNLTGSAGTTATLDQANTVASLGTFTTGSGFTLVDAAGLSIDGAVSGGTGTASISTTGDLTVNSTVSGNTAVQLNANLDNALVTIANTGGLASPGSVSVTADRIDLVGSGFIAGNTGNTTATPNAVLRAFSAARPITIGTADVNASTATTGTLGLTDAELDLVRASTLTIGNAANTGAISITAATSPALAPNVVLTNNTGGIAIGANFTATGNLTLTANGGGAATGAITRTAGTLQGNVVTLNAAAGIGSASAIVTQASTLTVDNTTTGDVQITQIGGATLAGTFRNQAPGGTLFLLASGSINTDTATVSTNNGAITLRADDPTDLNVTLTVGTGGLASGGAAINLFSADHVALAGSVNAGAGTATIQANSASALETTADSLGAITRTAGTVTGGTVALRAATGIGSAGGTSSINTAATTVSAVNTASGDVNIVDADSVSVSGTNTGGGSFNVTASGAGNTLTVNGGNINANTGSVTLTGDNMDIVGTVAGSPFVLLQAVTAGRPINLGTEVGTALSLTDGELDKITATNLRVGAGTAGAITIAADISPANATNLHLITGAGITGTAGGIVVPGLAIEAGGTVDITDNTTNITTLAANVTGGSFTLTNDVGTLAVGAVDGITGVTTSNANITLGTTIALSLTESVGAGNGTVSLTSTHGGITQTAAGLINADTLTGSAQSNVVLDQTNAVTNLGAFSIVGGFTLNDAGGLNVTGAVNTNNNGPVSITTSGPLNVTTGSITALSATLTATGGSGDINLTGSVNAGTNALDVLTLTAGGAITQNAGSVLTATTLTGSSAGATTLGQNNAITNLGAFTSNGFALNDAAGGLTLTGAVNGGTGAVSITTAGGALALDANNITGSGVSLTGTGVTQAAGSTVNAGAGTILVDGNDGAINLAGALTTTNGTATAVRIIDAATVVLPNITTGAAGTVVLGVAGADNLSGAVTQNTGTIINAGTLTGNTGSTVTLGNANTIANLGPFTSSGGFTLNDTTGGLTLTGAVNAGPGVVTITTAGGALALGANNVTGQGVSLAGTGVTQAAGSVVDAVADTILIDGNDGAINLAGALTTTNGTLTAVQIVDASTVALPNVTTGATGTLVLGGAAGDNLALAVAQNGTTIINVGTVTGNTGSTVTLGNANTIVNLGAFTSNGNFTLNDATGGLTLTGAVNAGPGAVAITTAGGALALGANSISGEGVSLTGTGVTQSLGSTVNAGAGTILIDGNDGAINMAGALTTTNATASAARIIDATTVALPGITTGAAGTVVLGEAAGDNLSGAVTQSGATILNTGTLIGNTASTVALGNNNTIANLGAFTSNGNFALNDAAGGLTLTGAVNAGTGSVTLTTTGGALALGASNISGQGASLTGTGVTQSAGSTVNAGAGTILVDANDGAINMAGSLTTTDATATAVRIIDASTVALPGITTGAAGTVVLGEAAGDNLTGAVTQNGTTIINTGTLTGNTASTVALGNNNMIANLGAFTSNGNFTLNDTSGGLALTGAVNAGTGSVTITTAGDALALSTNNITGQGVSLTGTGVTQSLGSTVNAGAGTILVDGNDGAINLAGSLTTTNATAAAVRIIDASTVALPGITTGAAGTVVLGEAGGDNLTGAVTQNGTTVISTGTLTGNTASTVNLGNNNTIANLGAFTSNGNFALNDTTGGLSVTGAVNAGTGAVTITTAGGSLVLSNNVTGQGVSLTGAGVTQDAGTTVNAGAGTILLDANDGSFNLSGTLTTTNGTAAAVQLIDAATVTLPNITTGATGTITLGGAGGDNFTGQLLQNLGTVINTGTITGNTANTVVLFNANTITNLGPFTSTGFTLNDTTGGLTLSGNVNAGAGGVTITTAGGPLALGTNSVSAGSTLALTGTGVTQSAGSTVNAGAGSIVIDANDGAIDMAGLLTTTNATTSAVSIIDSSTAALGNITTGAAGTVTLGGAGGDNVTGAVTQNGTTVISTGTLTGNTASTVALGNNNTIANLGAFTSNGNFALNDTTGGLALTGAVNAGTGSVTITTAGGALALGTNNITGQGVSLTGTGVTQSLGSMVNAGAGTILVDGNDGAINMAGTLTTTNNTGTAVRIIDAGAVTLPTITAASGSLVLGESAGDDISGAITQNAGTTINVTGLRGNSAGAVTLDGPLNQITNLGPFTSNGNFTLFDSAGGLVLAGDINADAGAVSLTTVGQLVTGAQNVTAQGVSLTATGVSQSAASIVNAGAGTITIDGNDGIIGLAGTLTTTNTSANAVRIIDAAATTLGNVTTGAGGTLTLGLAGADNLSGAVTQTAGTALNVGTLAGNGGSSVTLGNATNAVGNLGAFSAANGFTLNETGGLTVTGAVAAGTGLASITTSGDLAVTTGSVAGANVAVVATGAGSDILLGNNMNAGTGTLTLTADGAGAFINQTAGTLTAGTLTGSTATSATLGQATNAISTLGAFATGSGFTLNAVGGLTVTGAVAGGNGLASITTSGDLSLATGSVTGNGVTLVATGTGGDVLLGNSVNAGAGTLTLTANGAGALINQTGGTLTANTLTGSSATTATLAQTNAITNLGPFTTGTGFTLVNGNSLVLANNVIGGSGTASLTIEGSITGPGVVSGATVVLDSAAGVGTSAANRVNTAAGTLAARARTSGGVFISEADAVTLNTVGTVTNSTIGGNAFDVTTPGALVAAAPITTVGGAVTLTGGDVTVAAITTTGAAGAAGGAITLNATAATPTITLNGNLVSNGGAGGAAGGAIVLQDPVILGANVTLNTAGTGAGAGGNVSFAGNVDADAAGNNRTLTVNAGTGTATFSGSVGNTAALADLDVNAGGILFNGPATQTMTVNVNGGTANTVTFNAPVVLSQNVTVNTDGPGIDNNVIFTNRVNADTAATARSLTVTTGGGTSTFQQGIGAGVADRELFAVTLSGSNAVITGDVLVNGGGAVDLQGVTNLSFTDGAKIDTDRTGGASAAGNVLMASATKTNPASATFTAPVTWTIDATADGGAASGNVQLGTIGDVRPLRVFNVFGESVNVVGPVKGVQMAIQANSVATNGTGVLIASKDFANDSAATNAAVKLQGLTGPGVFGTVDHFLQIQAPGLFVVMPNESNALPPVFLGGDPSLKPVYEFANDPSKRLVLYNGVAPDSPATRAALGAALAPLREVISEVLMAGFAKENIRRQLVQGQVLETGLARPGIDEFTGEGVQQQPSCQGSSSAAGNGAIACR